MTIIVVIGMYTFRSGRSIAMSPGRRPSGSFPSHGHASPTTMRIAPAITSIRPIFMLRTACHSGTGATILSPTHSGVTVTRAPIVCCLLALPLVTLAAPPALDEPVTIPIEIVKGFPILVARIADRDMPLMFDLGGYESITLTQDAMRVGGVVPLHDGRQAWKDAKGNRMEAPRFVVKELRLGAAAFHEVEGHVAEFDPSFPTIPAGNVGHIGAALVRPFKVLLDYDGEAMTLIPGDSTRAEEYGCRGAVVPFLAEWEGDPITRAKTDLGELTFVWDTGASASIIRRGIVTTPTSAQDRYRTMRFEMGGGDFGPLELRSLDFAEPAGVDGFVGANFFATHVVCVDFPNRRLLVR